MKVLTILVPVYNTEKYISRCLDSILLKEILDDIEIITVSDGSKDNSAEIIKKYQKKYPDTVILIEKENGGHGSTINVGIKKATGKYFRVLDSDDWVNSIDFIKFVKRLKKENADLVVDDYQQELIYESRSEEIFQNNLKDNKLYHFDEFDITKIEKDYFAMANSTYKTSILRKSGLKLFEKTFYVDMQYNIIPMIEIDTFRYYKLNIYRYFIGRKDQSMNLQNFVRNRDDHERVMKFLIETCVENRNKISNNKYKYIEKITFNMLYTHYAIYCIYFTDKNQASKEIKKFDKYLYDKDKVIYNLTNDINFVRINRKTNFKFLKIKNKFILKLLNIIKKIF